MGNEPKEEVPAAIERGDDPQQEQEAQGALVVAHQSEVIVVLPGS
jgi:hypothetical protein